MKVLYLNPSGQLGGAEWSLLTLLAGLREEKPEFIPHLVMTEDGPLMARCSAMGIPAEVLPLPKRIEQAGDANGQGTRLQQMMKSLTLAKGGLEMGSYAMQLLGLMGRVRPDVIHTNGFKMHLLGAWTDRVRLARTKTPLVGHIHDYVSVRPLAGKLLKLSASSFAYFIANSESVAADVSGFLQTKKVVPIYNAINMERFKPTGTAADLDSLCELPPADPGSIRVGLVATFARWKGHLTFLRALAKLAGSLPIRGYIVGGPIYRTQDSQLSMVELQQEIDRLGLKGQVGCTGFLNDTAEAIRSLDIVVHASTKPEPFGMVIVEAMACGKPVIVSNLGGAAELFQDGVTGIGHCAGDDADLSAKIAVLARDRTLRETLRKNALESASKRFRQRDMALRVWDVYRDSLGVNAAGVNAAKVAC
jgi:glycosyltransferase involved in cell wall biosynthesis